MQRLEVSGAVRLIYRSLGVKGLSDFFHSQEFSVCLERGPRINKLHRNLCSLFVLHYVIELS